MYSFIIGEKAPNITIPVVYVYHQVLFIQKDLKLHFQEGTFFKIQPDPSLSLGGIPVSYTHLDVYKRQTTESTLANHTYTNINNNMEILNVHTKG